MAAGLTSDSPPHLTVKASGAPMPADSLSRHGDAGGFLGDHPTVRMREPRPGSEGTAPEPRPCSAARPRRPATPGRVCLCGQRAEGAWAWGGRVLRPSQTQALGVHPMSGPRPPPGAGWRDRAWQSGSFGVVGYYRAGPLVLGGHADRSVPRQRRSASCRECRQAGTRGTPRRPELSGARAPRADVPLQPRQPPG